MTRLLSRLLWRRNRPTEFERELAAEYERRMANQDAEANRLPDWTVDGYPSTAARDRDLETGWGRGTSPCG